MAAADSPVTLRSEVPNTDLVFYVKLFVKPELVAEWRAALDEIVSAMSHEPEFISCYLHEDASDPTQFTLYERWAEPSVESFLKNQMKPYRLEYDAKLEYLLQRPREPQVLLPLNEWHAQRPAM
ncbi:MAG: antibiotic biosynthesis monooxygenase [Phycisphaerae bacterium]|nr:antibiotic biosynthesis monooxygenase [Gemmatimonadaceae bacterium]